jgi:hypothetical protein
MRLLYCCAPSTEHISKVSSLEVVFALKHRTTKSLSEGTLNKPQTRQWI